MMQGSICTKIRSLQAYVPAWNGFHEASVASACNPIIPSKIKKDGGEKKKILHTVPGGIFM